MLTKRMDCSNNIIIIIVRGKIDEGSESEPHIKVHIQHSFTVSLACIHGHTFETTIMATKIHTGENPSSQ